MEAEIEGGCVVDWAIGRGSWMRVLEDVSDRCKVDWMKR